MAGLELDPWQQFVLTESLGERRDGKWSALEVGLVVSRQNGKGGTLEARELAGLFLIETDRLTIHSAHLFDTSMEAFERLVALIADTPQLSRMIAPRSGVSRSHGSEGIRLRNGKRIRFRTRTAGGGRGLTGDCVILDEAMILPRKVHGALMPLLSAVPNPQLWYTGSAVDEDVHEHGLVLSKIRERGLEGGDPRLAYFEWSVDHNKYDPLDPAEWAKANPALGIRISPEYVAAEQRSMDARTFSVERLAVGRWPRTDDEEGRVFSVDQWRSCADPDSHIDGRKVFAVDVTPDRSKGSIAVAGLRADGNPHVGIVENKTGTGWIVDLCVELKAAHKAKFVIDPKSPAAALIDHLVAKKITPEEIKSQNYARACGTFYDAVVEGKLRYPSPQPELDLAISAATRRTLGDAWAWDRRSLVDISPLVACTLALSRVRTAARPRVINMAEVMAREAQRKRADEPTA